MKTPIQLSDHFTYRRLFRFTLPSIASMIFASVYGTVDGYFVSNYAGEDPLCRTEYHYALYYDAGSSGQYDRAWRLRLDRQDPGGG